MFTSQVPSSFWGEAIFTTCYLINRLPSKSLCFHTPLSDLLKLFPQVRLLNSLGSKVLGCTGFVYDHSPTRDKLDSRAIKCVIDVFFFKRSYKMCISWVFPKSKRYKCYNPLLSEVFSFLWCIIPRIPTFLSQCPYPGGENLCRQPLGSLCFTSYFSTIHTTKSPWTFPRDNLWWQPLGSLCFTSYFFTTHTKKTSWTFTRKPFTTESHTPKET